MRFAHRQHVRVLWGRGAAALINSVFKHMLTTPLSSSATKHVMRVSVTENTSWNCFYLIITSSSVGLHSSPALIRLCNHLLISLSVMSNTTLRWKAILTFLIPTEMSLLSSCPTPVLSLQEPLTRPARYWKNRFHSHFWPFAGKQDKLLQHWHSLLFTKSHGEEEREQLPELSENEADGSDEKEDDYNATSMSNRHMRLRITLRLIQPIGKPTISDLRSEMRLRHSNRTSPSNWWATLLVMVRDRMTGSGYIWPSCITF